MKRKILLFISLIACIFLLNINTKAATSSSMAGRVDALGSVLNVRSGSTTSSPILFKLVDKSYITVLRQAGNWYYVEYRENKYGYVHKDYVDIVSKNVKKVDTGGGNLNARTGPATTYSSFDKIANNDYVITLEEYNNWAKVLFEGHKVGYVNKNYISNTNTYPSIDLKTPSYKQYDSKWAYQKITGTNRTIKEIGCLITSMAMSESYRKGVSITPLNVMNSQKFTSSGDMYWPSNYITNSTYNNYMSRIYSILKTGTPVLFGAKNKNGGQHWVLIYGYKGNNSLSASNFLINDPGSSTRTTLAQLLSSYPLFYKIAYYK